MKRALALALALASPGCVSVGPDYRAPEPSSPASFASFEDARLSGAAVADAAWWRALGDPVLAELVERALQKSPDARIAAARILEARAAVDVASADALPQVEFGTSYARARTSPNGPLAPPPGVGLVNDVWHTGFQASWDLDLFGRVRRAVEAAEADLGAVVADRDAVLVALSGDVGRAYVDLLGARRELDALAADEVSAADTVALTTSRRKGGLATELDVARAEAELASVRSQMPERRATESRALHRLAILVGEAPGALDRELASARALPAPPPRLAVGIPAALLARRPDVRRAERALAAETARIGVATADFYPDVSLSAAFGLDSLSGEDLFNAASRAWSIGPSLRWPIFAGGRIEAQLAAQDARAKIAAAQFDRAVLAALAEVEDAMSAYLRAWDRLETVRIEVEADRRAVTLARDVQHAGAGTFLDVLDADRRAHEAEVRLAQSEAAVTGDVIALYSALAGGWETVGALATDVALLSEKN
jgi:NodT family efflux transporter outer membrane factor (OMF) lipoprotein